MIKKRIAYLIQFSALYFFFATVFFTLILTFSWSWFSPKGWGSISQDALSLFSALGHLTPKVSLDRWYWFNERVASFNWQTDFYLHLYMPLFSSIILSFFVTKVCFKHRKFSNELEFVSGPELCSGKKATTHANKMQKRELKISNSTIGIKVHPKLPISTAREQNNFCILGTTGAGKSTILKPMIKQAIDRNDYAVIYDEKGEYTQGFYHSFNTILLAPWDARSALWDISKDVSSEQDAELLAQCLIPYSDTKEQIWNDGARIILTGMIVSLIYGCKGNWEWHDLYELLQLSPEHALLRMEPYYPTVQSLIQKNSKTTQGFYVHLITHLNWLKYLSLAWRKSSKESFSLSQWVKSGTSKRVIIIQANSEYEAVGKPLCNTVISFMTKKYLSSNNSFYRPTWLFIDEFANLPPNPSVKKWLELSRVYGGRSVICTQSLSQIRDIYGEDETNAILNLLSNVITLRLGTAGDDAIFTAQMLSEQTVEVPNYENANHIGIRSKQLLVEASDLTQLRPADNKGVEGYLFIPGWKSVYKLTWPLFTQPDIAKKFIPAKWLLDVRVEASPITPTPQNKNPLNKWS